MKNLKESPQAKVTANIVKLLNEKHLAQSAIADVLEKDTSNVNKLLQNKAQLSYNAIVKIANLFSISAIDLITYPDVYVPQQSPEAEPVEATLQIKLKKDKKDQVLKLVFGENNLEILNK